MMFENVEAVRVLVTRSRPTLRESCRLARVCFREYLVEAGRRALPDRESVFLPEDYAKMLAEQPTVGRDSQG